MYKLENGETLSKFCRSNKIPYSPLWERVSLQGMTPNEAVEDFLSKRGKPHYCNWTYGDITLSQYCKNNGLPYQKIINTYHNLNHYNKVNRKNISMDEIVKMFEDGTYKSQGKYFYNGKSLRSACMEMGVDYTKVMSLYYRTLKKKACKIEEVVEYYLNN